MQQSWGFVIYVPFKQIMPHPARMCAEGLPFILFLFPLSISFPNMRWHRYVQAWTSSQFNNLLALFFKFLHLYFFTWWTSQIASPHVPKLAEVDSFHAPQLVGSRPTRRACVACFYHRSAAMSEQSNPQKRWLRSKTRENTPLKVYLGVSKNSGTPKWMVYFMENPIKMDDLGVPLLLETPICWFIRPFSS